MAMTACYPTYDMSLSGSQSMSHHHHHHLQHGASMQQSNRAASILAATHQQQSQQSPQTTQQQQQQQQQQPQQPPQKDYSIPLHVDCSVEYELPNQAKPPVGGRVEPLLMIHPCYFRKMESQRRSPFINNMPNSSSLRSSQSNQMTPVSSSSTVSTSSSRRPNVIGASSSIAAKNQTNAHLMSNQNVIPNHQQQSHIQQQQQQQISHQHSSLQHQNLQQQLDEYVQRQMAHISQQAQFPSIAQHQQQQQQQSNSQYNMPAQHQQQQQQQQMQTSGNWERYLNNIPNASMLGKVNIPNQNAYKKSGKRHLTATCANSYSTSHLEGALPNGIARWDEKTVMATIPRDYQSGTELQQQQQTSTMPSQLQMTGAKVSSSNGVVVAGASSCNGVNTNNNSNNNSNNMYRGITSGQQQAVLMSGATKRDRDPMLSGGCIYSNSNNSNTTDINNLVSTGLWPIQKSPMAAIPNNNYHQAGPDSIPNNNHSSNSNSNSKTTSNGMTSRQPSGNTVIHHSHYAQQQQQQQQQNIHQSDKLSNNNNNSNNNNSNANNNNNNNTSNNNNNVITVKYRQYRNAHRMHPYMMNNMTAPSVNNTLSGVSYFPQLNGPFSQIQQVSCYNV